MRAPRSLRARLTLAAVAALILGGTLAGVLLITVIERDGRRAVDADLRERAESIVGRGPGPGGGRGPEPFGRRGRGFGFGDDRLLAGSGTFVQVAVGGRVVEQRGDLLDDPPSFPDRDGLSTVQVGGEPWRSLALSSERGGALRIQVLSTLAPVEARVADTRRLVLLIGLAALAVTAIAAWAFTTVAVRPLERLRAGAARVSGTEDLTTTLPDDEGPIEVRSLAHALNDMLTRLRSSTEAMQRALQATRRFAADAGHELRTPLTGLRANLDTLERNPELAAGERQALLREMTAEQERIVHLLEGLQALARGDAAESLPRERVELGDLVDAAVYAARRRHPDVRYALDEQVGDAAVHGWAGGLRLIADNLLDNAALHGRDGGRIDVRLEANEDRLVLRVGDDGRGIAEDDRARVLEPFTRGPRASAPGTGLGLAIVAQQVALHGGELSLADSALGGLEVCVRLPRAGPAARERGAPVTTREK